MAGTDSVEREILIDAPMETVWSIVTEPDHINRWLSNSAQLDLRPGGELTLSFDRVGTARGTIERVERPNVFAFRWVTPEPDRDPSTVTPTLVEFLLQPEGDRTRLRVVESGFASGNGTEQEISDLAAQHRGGWGTFLDQLVAYVSSADVPA